MKKFFITFILLILPFVLLAEGEVAPTPKEIYENAFQKFFSYNKSERESAFKDFKSIAENYNPAKMRLGICYFYGKGESIDTEKGIKIIDDVFPYLEGNAINDINAKYEYANALLLGIGTKQKKYEGFKYMLQAAQKGHLVAMETVGKCLMSGFGCEKNIPQSISWFEKAKEKGSTDALYYLAYFNQNGLGFKKDHKKAMDMLLEGETKGNLDCVIYLATIYLNGLGESKDEAKAFEYFLKSAEGGHPRGMYYTGRCLLDGVGTTKNVDKGLSWIVKAAGEGDDLALDMMIDENKGGKKDN